MTDTSDTPQPKPFRGIFLIEGGTLSIDPFEITFHPDGSITSTKITFKLRQNMGAHWLDAAYHSLLETRAAQKRAMDANATDDEQALGKELQNQSVAAMQTVIASCAAIDAHYAIVKKYVPLPADLIAKWKDSRTARHAQISEVLRRAFVMTDERFLAMKDALKKSFELRDEAVHPPANAELPVLYPDFQRGVEWRIYKFRYENALTIAKFMVGLFAATIKAERRVHDKGLEEYSTSSAKQIAPLLPRWEADFGKAVPDSWHARP